jgi:urease accessory protein
VCEVSNATSTLLLLVDGRLPTGGHAHSGGIEAAIADGRVCDLSSLRSYLLGRLQTTGLVDAAFASAAAKGAAGLFDLNAEALARCSSPALRRASQVQANGLLRAARRIWPDAALSELEVVAASTQLQSSVALGVVARAAGLDSYDAALTAAHSSVSGPAWAAVRLLGFDPFSVVAVLSEIASDIDAIAHRAEIAASTAVLPAYLPAAASPLSEIAAEHHATWEVRLFVS